MSVPGMKIAFQTVAKKLLPSGLYNHLLFAAYFARVAALLPGNRKQTCPICDFTGRFPAFGLPPRLNAQCPKCRSLERHRLFVLCDREHSLFNDQQTALHFAPEPSISTFVSCRVRDYRTADIEPGRADMALDIENIDLPDAVLDVIIANHVLEHVDDAKALREIFRILRPGGRFISMVPIIEGWDHTYENPSIVTPADRARHFGQRDHVRYYGRDYRDRIRNAGFNLQEFGASGEDCVR
jgi:SAM-dependent methyltransferase